MKKFDQSRDIALFLDKLRALRNIPQEDFIFEIISMRQYRRYMSGDSTLSYLVLDKLSKRLGFSAEFIIMELESEKIKQTQEINALYNTVVSKDIEVARDLLAKIDNRHLIDDNNRLLFAHSKNIFEYNAGINSEYVTVNRTKKLLDLEKTLNKKVLSTSELLILVSFFHFDSFENKNIIAEKLSAYINHNISVVSGHNIRVLALILEELSRYFCIIENYDRTLFYAVEGIKYSNAMKSYYLLDTIYYFAAASCHKLNDINSRDKYIFKCLSLLFSEGNQQKISKYIGLFKQKLDFDIKQYLDMVLQQSQ